MNNTDNENINSITSLEEQNQELKNKNQELKIEKTNKKKMLQPY